MFSALQKNLIFISRPLLNSKISILIFVVIGLYYNFSNAQTTMAVPTSEVQKKPTQISSDSISFSDYHVKPFLKKAFDDHSLVTLISAAAAVSYSRYHDLQTQNEWKDHQKMSKEFAEVGDFAGGGLLSVGIFALQYTFDENETASVSHARAIVWSTVASTTLKVAFARPRPSNKLDDYSFPSGHTTRAFSTATALAYAYGWKAAVLAYPLAAFVGLSRMSDNVHWGSDVVGGAFLGYWTARASYYSKEDAANFTSTQTQFQWIPVISSELVGAHFNWQY